MHKNIFFKSCLKLKKNVFFLLSALITWYLHYLTSFNLQITIKLEQDGPEIYRAAMAHPDQPLTPPPGPTYRGGFVPFARPARLDHQCLVGSSRRNGLRLKRWSRSPHVTDELGSSTSESESYQWAPFSRGIYRVLLSQRQRVKLSRPTTILPPFWSP